MASNCYSTWNGFCVSSLLAPKAFGFYNAEDFYKYVESLYLPQDSKKSHLVEEFTLNMTKAGMRIKCSRDENKVTRDEIKLLAIEYRIDELELLARFVKLKWRIEYGDNDERKQYDKIITKTDDEPRKARKRKASSKDKLFKSRPLTDLP